MRCSLNFCARLGRPPKALFTAACGLLEGVLRYMGQHKPAAK
ncbi:D-fructose-responsive transcription factor [Citrobacter koseri]|uniref:D-fructose-responsive transcription factor n=1 Tax=Citrobacter koseri TaxID=545 RepID=A0A2X2V8I1_CITKO|nr:D-fructose-responsive transcription factor [Citrobacter koseri]